MINLSIIVPVYNVAPYLRKCVDSLLAQDYDNYEIILVDDGSTDNCPAICDDYSSNITHQTSNITHVPFALFTNRTQVYQRRAIVE